MIEELKPCPFCGSVPADNRHECSQGCKWGGVVCPDCGCFGPEVRTHYHDADKCGHEADRAWNRRA